MDFVKKVEAYLAPWYIKAPHLPVGGRKWLADNIWWIVLVFVILGGLGVLGLLSAMFVGSLILTGIAGAAGAALGGLALLVALLVLALALVNLVLGILAINPLKNKQKKGWLLLLAILMVNVVSGIVALLFAFDGFSFVREIVMAAIGAYFLFEIREYFEGHKHVDDVKQTPEVKPSSEKAE